MELNVRGQGETLEVRFAETDWFSLLAPPRSLTFEQGESLCQWVASKWSAFPNSSSKALELPKIFQQPKTLHPVFYPGSFHPWHNGHSACVSALKADTPLIVVPDRNPWKAQERIHNISPWHEILTISQQLPKQENLSLYPGFWASSDLNPTVDWLPHTTFSERSLLIGMDSFANLPKWKDIHRLLQSLACLYVVPRESDQSQVEIAHQKILELHPDLKINVLEHHEFETLSSTQIRKGQAT